MIVTQNRRQFLAGMAAGLTGTVSGCSVGASFPDANVVAGPNGDAVFEPVELTVSVGDTVKWGFATAGHNVSCRPSDDERVSLPANADPFATYGPEESAEGSVVPRGETFEYRFDVPGEYVYLCIPHANRGMVGTVNVD